MVLTQFSMEHNNTSKGQRCGIFILRDWIADDGILRKNRFGLISLDEHSN